MLENLDGRVGFVVDGSSREFKRIVNGADNYITRL
jgi:hypothetical protein